MDDKHIKKVTVLTDEIYAEVANLWEELVDQNYHGVDEIVNDLQVKLKQLKSNINNTATI